MHNYPNQDRNTTINSNLQQLRNTALDGELGRAADLAGGCGGDAGVQAGVLGVDVLEDQRQRVLLVLEQDLKDTISEVNRDISHITITMRSGPNRVAADAQGNGRGWFFGEIDISHGPMRNVHISDSSSVFKSSDHFHSFTED